MKNTNWPADTDPDKAESRCLYEVWDEEQAKLPEWQRSNVCMISCRCEKCRNKYSLRQYFHDVFSTGRYGFEWTQQ